MSTQTNPIVLSDPTHGMNLSKSSHVIGASDPNSWRYCENFRVIDGSLVYVPGEKNTVRFDNVGKIVLAIIPVIQPGAAGYNILVLTESSAFFYTGETGTHSAVKLAINGGANEFDYSADELNTHQRWSYVIYGGYVFLTNLENKVMNFRYNATSSAYEVRTLDDSDTSSDPIIDIGTIDQLIPKAKYIAVLEGHIITAHLKESHYWDGNSTEPLAAERTFPARVRWSQRDVIGQALYNWYPGTGSNADFKDINSNQAFSEFGNEITGMNVLRNSIALYTRSGIWEMTYVGPTQGIMKFRQAIAGIGCHFPWSVAVGVDVHYFIGIDNFYAFNGSSVTPIGTPIWKYFQDTINKDRSVAERTYSWTRFSEHQVWWFFVSEGAYDTWCYDKILIFDWVDNTWTVQSARATFSVAELDTNLDDEEASIIRALIYGGYQGNMLTEIDIADSVDDVDYYNHAVLISQDFQFSDPEAVKDINRMYIDAEVENAVIDDGTYKGKVFWGINVYVAVRDYVGDPLVFDYAGMWNRYGDDDPEDGLTRHVTLTVRKSGRILTFAFVPAVSRIETDEESIGDLAILFEKIYANV